MTWHALERRASRVISDTLRGRLCFNVLRAPSLPLSEVAFKLAAKKFGVQLEDPGEALGSPAAIKAALKAAGFNTVKVQSLLGSVWI